MTKKDYELIAQILFHTMPEVTQDNPSFDTWREIVEQFVFELSLKNPEFQKNRFYMACGIVKNPS